MFVLADMTGRTPGAGVGRETAHCVAQHGRTDVCWQHVEILWIIKDICAGRHRYARQQNEQRYMRAQLGACQVGERNLIAMLDKYGVETVEECIDTLLDNADKHMRKLISSVPDGTYVGTSILEDSSDQDFGDMEFKATVEISGSDCKITLDSPEQIPYFVNSYEGNTYSGVYLGLMMFAKVEPPYNEGLYRCIELDPPHQIPGCTPLQSIPGWQRKSRHSSSQ